MKTIYIRVGPNLVALEKRERNQEIVKAACFIVLISVVMGVLLLIQST